jgi:hypothetical protein
MRFVSAAAPLIRLAAADEDHAQRLFAAVEVERRAEAADEQALSSFIERPAVAEEDLAALTPDEWHWYASWRQAFGGQLERIVLDYLTDCATTRFAQYQVRALVLRDAETNAAARIVEEIYGSESAPEVADSDSEPVVSGSVGLTWLREQAQGARVRKLIAAQAARIEEALAVEARAEEPIDELEALAEEALELAADALQCQTDATTFVLIQLALLGGDRAELVGQYLDNVADQRRISSEDSASWYQRDEEPLGG